MEGSDENHDPKTTDKACMYIYKYIDQEKRPSWKEKPLYHGEMTDIGKTYQWLEKV